MTTAVLDSHRSSLGKASRDVPLLYMTLNSWGRTGWVSVLKKLIIRTILKKTLHGCGWCFYLPVLDEFIMKFVMNQFWNSWDSWALIVTVKPAVVMAPGEGGEPTVLGGPYLCQPHGYLRSIWRSSVIFKEACDTLILLCIISSIALLNEYVPLQHCLKEKLSCEVFGMWCFFFLYFPFYSIQPNNTIY